MKQGIAAVVASLALGLSGCTAASNAPVVTFHAEPLPSSTPTPWKADPTPNPGCVKLSPAMLQAIAAGVKGGKKLIPVSGMAVRSSTYSRDSLYVIFMSFTTRAGETPPNGGYWAATGLEPSATIYNGEGAAPFLTDFPDAQTDWPELRLTDPSWHVAGGCVGLL
jgi:hypothetical protein